MKFASGTELQLHLDGDRGPGLGRHLRLREGQDRNQPQQAGQQSEGNRPRVGQSRSEQAAGDGLSHRELDRVHQEPQALQRRHRNRPALVTRSATWSTSCATSAGSAKSLKWDPVAERFTNCDEANKLLSRPRRKGYELPTLT